MTLCCFILTVSIPAVFVDSSAIRHLIPAAILTSVYEIRRGFDLLYGFLCRCSTKFWFRDLL